MKLLRASVTLRKTVPYLNVYLPCCSDTLQATRICSVVHTSLQYKFHIASVVTIHFLRLVGDRNASYLEARQKRARLVGIVIRETQVLLLAEHSSFILSTNPEPAVGNLWRRYRCHQLICGGLKYISGNVLKICFLGLWVWWCIQFHACYDGCFHTLD